MNNGGSFIFLSAYGQVIVLLSLRGFDNAVYELKSRNEELGVMIVLLLRM